MRRSKEVSAGLLAFRRRDGLEVLLAHPGGPFWAKKDAGAWTIPKGLLLPGDDLISAARREFTEETGLAVHGPVMALAPVNQKSRKTVHAFAVEADLDVTRFASNEFEMEWPPRSGRLSRFPEIDRVAYFSLSAALAKILVYQRPFLHELTQRLDSGTTF